MYIYDPLTGAVKAQLTNIIGSDAGGGMPFVGNIDDEPTLEILVGEGAANTQYVVAHDVNFSTGAITLKKRLRTGDESNLTGLTLFDFNQDGKSEIVYRDVEKIYIYDGDANPLYSYPCYAGTGTEYPVVADIDLDGEAEIVIGGYDGQAHTGGS